MENTALGATSPYLFVFMSKAGPGAHTSCVVVFLCSVSYDERDLFILLLLVILITITVSFHNITRDSRVCSTLYHIAFVLPSCFTCINEVRLYLSLFCRRSYFLNGVCIYLRIEG